MRDASAIRTSILAERPARRSWRPLQRARHVLLHYPLGVLGGVLIFGFVTVALLAPVIAPHNPRAFAGPGLQGPSSRFWFGTNNLGQDVVSRTAYGAQVSLAIGLSAVAIGTVTATVLGLITGYFGRWPDMIIQRCTEVIAAFPGLVLLLLIVAAFGRPNNKTGNIHTVAWELRTVVLAVALGSLFGVSRVIRAAVLGD